MLQDAVAPWIISHVETILLHVCANSIRRAPSAATSQTLAGIAGPAILQQECLTYATEACGGDAAC